MSERLDVVVIGPGAAGLRRLKAWRGPDGPSLPGRRGIVCTQVHFVRLDDGKIREHGARFLFIHATPGGLTMNDGQFVPSATEFLIPM